MNWPMGELKKPTYILSTVKQRAIVWQKKRRQLTASLTLLECFRCDQTEAIDSSIAAH